MHRGPVKDKTPEGSAKRGRLLQALRSAHLERNEGVLDQLICNPRDPCQDLIRTARFDGLRLLPSAVSSGTPFLHCHRAPNLASLASTTTTFHSQVTTPFTEFSRLHEINPGSETFATGHEEPHSLKVIMENTPNSAISLHRGPLTRSAAAPKVKSSHASVIGTDMCGGRLPPPHVIIDTNMLHNPAALPPKALPKVTPASSIANRMPVRSALFGRTNGAFRTPLHEPSSPTTPFTSIIRTEKYGGVRDPSFKENALKDDKMVFCIIWFMFLCFAEILFQPVKRLSSMRKKKVTFLT
ncbi:uncharacterized protein DEA37_0012016 [Paragonimus westermani]|uniref:Uncharacterized protein n=1 Tax=Paragonimus westermani TaxID=34504 RepID=A0A5J4ND66_9TREM|nr:uncharacterized protein DEA37_0012016 [Paragonimus westermani]